MVSMELLQSNSMFGLTRAMHASCLNALCFIRLMELIGEANNLSPLTELPSKRCKRCGFYEENSFVSDEVYEEWEFCPSDFTEPDGKYIRFKEKEFNATFLCPKCVPSANASNSASSSQDRGKGMHAALIILISVVVSTVLVLGVVAVYKYWQKKKREQDQARFLKLFEAGDDIEDELGLGNVI